MAFEKVQRFVDEEAGAFPALDLVLRRPNPVRCRDVGMRLRQVAEVESVYEKGGRPIAAGELPKDELMRLIKDLELQMKTAAKDLAFEKAAALRDEIVDLRGLMVLQAGPEGIDDAGMPSLPRTTKRVMGRRRRGP